MSTDSTEVFAQQAAQSTSNPMYDQTFRRNGRRGKGGHRGRNPQRANGRDNRKFESEHITNSARLDQSPAEPANEPSLKSKVNATEDSEGENKENANECHICAEKIVYYAVEQQAVIITCDPEKLYQDYKSTDLPYTDQKLKLSFESKEMYDETMKLLRFNCPSPSCDAECCDGWPALKKHVKKVHNMLLCDICISNKKVFAHEHALYTARQLERHYKVGDQNVESGFKGHPKCEFCDIVFYDNDQLYVHCRDRHEECYLCARNGIRHAYYENYDLLEIHFEKKHYLCMDEGCRARKFVVFATDIDLKAHEIDVHGSSINGQKAKYEARRIRVNFIYDEQHARARGRHRDRERQQLDGPSRPRNLEINHTRAGNALRSITPDGTSNSIDELSPPSSTLPARPNQVREEEFPTLSSVVRPSGAGSTNANTNSGAKAQTTSKMNAVGKGKRSGDNGRGGVNGQDRSNGQGGSNEQRAPLPSSTGSSSRASTATSNSTSAKKKGKGKAPVQPVEEFPSLPSIPKQKSPGSKKNDAKGAWGRGGTFANINSPSSSEPAESSSKKKPNKKVILRIG
ncbi:800_t:CDS:2 [Paraglomus brasilianum]|uniref:800_t:CDS:1 n=1 Tax=Paraglomus brasilianum TaxID=144538 RepID=A0A9N9F3L7_9GLOM|nr:800_t:CDS:2 [Paraglomus brasilianum]